ncbi:MAG: hypothetical protein QGF94_05190 [Candidatus Thalassarchaeaceae archaeon]|nr:hypothetical protein [Candidatus Thalassarchaeaceae archaeon]
MHELSGTYPVRMPVWWARRGASGPHPSLPGISGRYVVLRHPKIFRRFEGMIAKLLRAPSELRRPLDDLNSLLWELCDGYRTFEEICTILDTTFHERISPVVERTSAAIEKLSSLGYIGLSNHPFKGNWSTGPGIDPSGLLDEPSDKLDLDWNPIDGDIQSESE